MSRWEFRLFHLLAVILSLDLEPQNRFVEIKIKSRFYSDIQKQSYKSEAQVGPEDSVRVMLLLAPHVLGVWIHLILQQTSFSCLSAFVCAVPSTWNALLVLSSLYLPLSKLVNCFLPQFPYKPGIILAALSQLLWGLSELSKGRTRIPCTCSVIMGVQGSLFRAKGIEEGWCGSNVIIGNSYASNIIPLSTFIPTSLYESPQGMLIFSQTANTPADNKSGVKKSGFYSWLSFWEAERPWESQFTSSSFSFLIYARRGWARISIAKAPSKSSGSMILSLVSGLQKALYQKWNDSQLTLLIFFL